MEYVIIMLIRVNMIIKHSAVKTNSFQLPIENCNSLQIVVATVYEITGDITFTRNICQYLNIGCLKPLENRKYGFHPYTITSNEMSGLHKTPLNPQREPPMIAVTINIIDSTKGAHMS